MQVSDHANERVKEAPRLVEEGQRREACKLWEADKMEKCR